MTSRAEGLVLRGFRMSESSKLVALFTREFGKIKLAARGARRPRSKFGASLEPMTLGHYLFFRRENRDIQTLMEGDIVDSFPQVKQHYGRLAAGSAICELLDYMTEEEDRNPLLLSIALDALRWVGAIPDTALDVPIWFFQVKAAGALGYRPHLSGCVHCGTKLDGSRVGFSPVLGGALCGSHSALGMPVKREILEFLESLQVGRPGRIDAREVTQPNRMEINRLLRSFLNQHLVFRYRPRAMEFFDRLRAADSPGKP